MDKKFSYYVTIIFMTLIVVFSLYTSTRAAILFTVDYETGAFNQGPVQPAKYVNSYATQIVRSPVRAGAYAARFELRYTDPIAYGGMRAERSYKSGLIGKIGGPDEWYGFSTYFPPDYKVDSGYASRNELVAQWHDTPDKGEASKSPPLAFYTGGGQWYLVTRYSSKAIQTSNDGTVVILWKAPYQTGVWADWVVHVKWSYKSDGFIEIWKDGKKIVDYKGPNAYNNLGNNYFQWGIYKWPWNNHKPTDVTTRVVYNDELRVGDSNSSYAEVAPRRSTPDTTTPPAAPALSSVTLSTSQLN